MIALLLIAAISTSSSATSTGCSTSSAAAAALERKVELLEKDAADWKRSSELNRQAGDTWAAIAARRLVRLQEFSPRLRACAGEKQQLEQAIRARPPALERPPDELEPWLVTGALVLGAVAGAAGTIAVVHATRGPP